MNGASNEQMLIIYADHDPEAPVRAAYGPARGNSRTTVLAATDEQVLDVVRRWLLQARSAS